MPRSRGKISSDSSNQSMRPSLTPEARENQMIALAMDLVERRLREGTASSQETTHFLKLATMKEQLEREKLMKETELIKAKAETLKSVERSEELYRDALAAFKSYTSGGDKNTETDD